MKNQLVLFFLVMSWIHPLKAQQKTPLFDKTETNAWFFQVGYANINSSKLSNFYPSSNKESLLTDFLTLGLSTYITDRRAVFGGSFDFSFNRSKNDSSNTLKSSLVNVNAMVELGYDLIKRDKITIFPRLGIGGGFSFLNISNNQSLNPSQIASSPFNQTTLINHNFIIDLGLGMDFCFMKEEIKYGDDIDIKSTSVGIRIGYLNAFDAKKWTYTGGKIQDPPPFGPSAFYIKLLFGRTSFYE